MKKRKVRMLPALIVGAAALFCACSSGGGDDDGPPVNAVEIPAYSGGKILKNKVVSLSEGGGEYYEYLTFTGETGGTYALYKDGEKVSSYTNGDGEKVSVPESFTYDAATGKFSAGGVSSYMFETKKAGEEVSVIAAEEMTCAAERPALCAKWSASKITFTFDAENNVEIAPSDVQTFSVPYTNDDGWITAGPFPLFYSSSARMFYLAYTTERTEVDEVGRNAAGGQTEFVSPVFILADIRL